MSDLQFATIAALLLLARGAALAANRRLALGTDCGVILLRSLPFAPLQATRWVALPARATKLPRVNVVVAEGAWSLHPPNNPQGQHGLFHANQSTVILPPSRRTSGKARRDRRATGARDRSCGLWCLIHDFPILAASGPECFT